MSCAEGLAQFSEEISFHQSVQGHLKDTEALLELYKASQFQIHEELILESIGSWSAQLLKQQLCSNKISRSVVDPAEVYFAILNIPSPFNLQCI
jgi:hypothetical protein